MFTFSYMWDKRRLMATSLFNDFQSVVSPGVIAKALHLKSSDILANWETRSGVKGFLSKFLMEKARLFWDDMDLQAFEEILVLLIYRLVLFSNPDQLIDVNAVKSFLTRNLVPILLGDVLNSLHTRTMRKWWTLMCCLSLLSR